MSPISNWQLPRSTVSFVKVVVSPVKMKKNNFQLMILLLPSLLLKWFIGWTQNNAKFRDEFGKSQTWLSKTRLKYRKSEEIHWSTPIAYFLVSLLF